MVSNKASRTKKEKKISSQANQVESPQKEIQDSFAFGLADDHQKQHMQPTEMLKKNDQYLLKMADFKIHTFLPSDSGKSHESFFKGAPVSKLCPSPI